MHTLAGFPGLLASSKKHIWVLSIGGPKFKPDISEIKWGYSQGYQPKTEQ